MAHNRHQFVDAAGLEDGNTSAIVKSTVSRGGDHTLEHRSTDENVFPEIPERFPDAAGKKVQEKSQLELGPKGVQPGVL